MRDRTHWFGCWEYHHKCALARIEQLEKALARIKDIAFTGAKGIPSSRIQLQVKLDHIIFEAERMENNEEHTRHWNQVGT